MDPQERLDLLYLSDQQSMKLDARLSRRVNAAQAQSQKAPVPAINDPGDPSSAGSTPAMSPNPQHPSDESNPGISLQDVPVQSSMIFHPEIPNPTSFTSAVTMARYAVKYCSGELAKIVSERFYDGGKFWNRTWDLYYLPVPQSVSNKPFLLIPTEQAQALLDEINLATNFRLTLTGLGKNGLVLDFTDEEREYFHPVFVGRSSNLEQKEALVARLPLPLDSWGDCSAEDQPEDPPQALVTYQFKVTASVTTIKVKPNKDAEKKAKQEKRDRANKKLDQCLGRVAAYFGLRPPLKEDVPQPSFANGQLEPVDVLSPAQFLFHDMPIFISLDTEWMEDCGILTEVGISVLDTYDLQGVVPGDFGHMWISQIRARHLRIAEYWRHVNSKYQQGCPDFFHHGKSEFIMNANVARVVDKAFSPPPIMLRGRETKRTVILVGLNLKNDIEMLRGKDSRVFVGLDASLPPPCSSAIHEVVDVANLFRVYSGEANPPGLANLMKYLQIVGLDLHNAGNDAYHTLEALVRLMLQVAGEKPWSYEGTASKVARRNALSTTEAVQTPTVQDQAMMDTFEPEQDDYQPAP